MWCSSHDITCDKSTNQSQKTTRLCFQHLHEQILNRTIGILQQWIHVEADITHTLLKKKQATRMMWSYNDDAPRGKSFPGWEDWLTSLLWSSRVVPVSPMISCGCHHMTWFWVFSTSVCFFCFSYPIFNEGFLYTTQICSLCRFFLCPQPAQSFCRSYFYRSGVWL